jgi:aldehyde:ferredoxin oxidoreductase
MLGVTNCFEVLTLIDAIEKTGLDVMSAGVALAWATEALEKGIISEKETLLPLRFGDASDYRMAVDHLAKGTNEFYELLGKGTMIAAKQYGGTDFACVLGQEMAGYATGEVFFVSQALGLRHSHLDAAGYSYDQKHTDKNTLDAVEFLIQDERERAFLTSMVACLFARNIYTKEMLADCLRSVGYPVMANTIDTASTEIQKLRWKARLDTGFVPNEVPIPKRFTEISTCKGPVDDVFLKDLKDKYSRRILQFNS